MKVPEPYVFESLLNQSASATTVLARDPGGQAVVIKILLLKDSQSWKAFDLLQREAYVLQSLQHPAIPCLLAFGKISDPTEAGFYLVTEYIEAPSLQTKIDQGWRCNRSQMRQIALQILDVLDYLHHLLPPVIHRDLKPANLLLDADQKIYLIDFGGVQKQIASETDRGSTIIGTYGYMAPEQFGGRAVTQSDLYALGASLVHLLSGVAPAQMPQQGLRLVFEPYLALLPAHDVWWFKRLLDPEPLQRLQTADQARQALLEEQPPPPAPGPSLAVDEGVQMSQLADQMIAQIEGNSLLPDFQISLTPQVLRIEKVSKKGLKKTFELYFSKIEDLYLWHGPYFNYTDRRVLIISYRFHLLGLPFLYTRQKKIILGSQPGLDRMISALNQAIKAYLVTPEN